MCRLTSPLVSFLLLDDSKGTLCKVVKNYVSAVLQNHFVNIAITCLSVSKSTAGGVNLLVINQMVPHVLYQMYKCATCWTV